MDFSTQINTVNFNNPKEFLIFVCVFFKNNLDLTLIPILSWIFLICITYLYFFAGPAPFMNESWQGKLIPMIPYLLTYYFLMSFCLIYFNAMLIAVTVARLHNQPCSIITGFNLVNSRSIYILGWAMLCSTIGLLLWVLARISNKLGELICGLFDLVWPVVYYFVVPFIIVKGVGPFSALNLSSRLIGHGITKVRSTDQFLGMGLACVLLVFYVVFKILGSPSIDLTENLVLTNVLMALFFVLLTFSRAIEAIIKCALFIKLSESYPENNSLVNE